MSAGLHLALTIAVQLVELVGAPIEALGFLEAVLEQLANWRKGGAR